MDIHYMRFLLVLLFLGTAQAAPKGDRLAEAGLDAHALDAAQREQALALLDKYSSPCGRAHSLYTSLTTDKTCKRAPFAGRFILFLVGLGLPAAEIEQHYEGRFVTPTLGSCKPGGPVRGDEKAALTICEFSDFQCPHCKAAEPILKKLLDEYKGRVKLVFKNFPLSSHNDARAAAAAAAAAAEQGKFWQMHDLLFDHQDNLSAGDLEGYARQLKLDLARWHTDTAAALPRVEAERNEGLGLGVNHTPTIFIGDREYKGPMRYEFMKDWIDEALAR
jgi:predicted DsbA family dithiol-disulfide isomerase